jgi:hypothetical protein
MKIINIILANKKIILRFENLKYLLARTPVLVPVSSTNLALTTVSPEEKYNKISKIFLMNAPEFVSVSLIVSHRAFAKCSRVLHLINNRQKSFFGVEL